MKAEHYLKLPYTKTLTLDGDGEVVARIEELEGCVAHGATEQEALEALSEAQQLWVEEALAAGIQIPKPTAQNEVLPSGRWVQRVPRTLHKRIAEIAKREGVSLNQWVATTLAEGAGRRRRLIHPEQLRAEIAALVRAHASSEREQPHAGTWAVFEPSTKYASPRSVFSKFTNNLVAQLPDRGRVQEHSLDADYADLRRFFEADPTCVHLLEIVRGRSRSAGVLATTGGGRDKPKSSRPQP